MKIHSATHRGNKDTGHTAPVSEQQMVVVQN